MSRRYPKVLNYLDAFGVPWRLCRDLPPDWPLWNGSWLYIVRGMPNSRNREMKADLILHELAHWQLEAQYRHLPNYGLGPDPLEGGYDDNHRRRSGDGPREDLAAVLTVCHARAARHHWRQVAYDFGCAPTDPVDTYRFRDALTWPVFLRANRETRTLQRLKLIDEHGEVRQP